MATTKLHHMKGSRSIRLFWVLEELGLQYGVAVHDYGSPEWAKLSPLAKAPVLEYAGETLDESAAIILRLLADHPSGAVESAPGRESHYWAYFAEGSLMLYIQPSVFARVGRKQLKRDKSLGPEAQKGADAMEAWVHSWSAKNAQLAFAHLEKYIGEREWFSGTDRPGLGDFMLLTVIGGNKTPAIAAWKKRIEARPAYQRAMARMQEEEAKAKKARL